MRGSNSRHPACKAGATTTELISLKSGGPLADNEITVSFGQSVSWSYTQPPYGEPIYIPPRAKSGYYNYIPAVRPASESCNQSHAAATAATRAAAARLTSHPFCQRVQRTQRTTATKPKTTIVLSMLSPH